MAISTLTDKGQTTVPQEIRDALKVKPRQRLTWSLRDDGTAVVRPQPSALKLFGSLKSSKKFPGRAAEQAAVVQSVGRHAAKEGME
ncbi:MAG TPA: type II toxin-antitoxin system PrlF family antitoxin [Candidatus Saccharimonadales bacterium]|nr:type II toxin-antitoxin system PrlF family antitoxin [Candidatus Saccharimonadales bacterium]